MTKREGRLACELRFAQAGAADDQETVDIEIVAYTGSMIQVGYGPEVVDLSGLKAAESIPLLVDHDAKRIAGYSTAIENDGQRLVIKGKLLVGQDEDEGRRVRKRAKAGFPYQASMGWRVLEDELVPAGKSRTVNGRTFEGPFFHDKRTELFETSVLSLGADNQTTVKAAAAAKHEELPTMSEIDKERGRVREIRAAFAKDVGFAMEAIEAGWSLVEAKAAYSDRLAAQVEVERKARTEAEEAAKKAQAEAEKARAASASRVPAVRPANDAGTHGEAAPLTAREQFAALCAKAREAGMSRSEAVAHVAKTAPEIHRAFLAESNPGKAEPAYRAASRR